jgi:hypothetical protein
MKMYWIMHCTVYSIPMWMLCSLTIQGFDPGILRHSESEGRPLKPCCMMYIKIPLLENGERRQIKLHYCTLLEKGSESTGFIVSVHGFEIYATSSPLFWLCYSSSKVGRVNRVIVQSTIDCTEPRWSIYRHLSIWPKENSCWNSLPTLWSFLFNPPRRKKNYSEFM